ncbi:MAG TPA: hypothetical protein VGX21_05470 [Methylomirabilota bacterium]|nr:hypothetical protein [Methylomirabilota bacterium]
MTSPVTIEVGENNFFSPGVLFRNQPTEFFPGVHHWVFATSFQVSGSQTQITWERHGAGRVQSQRVPPDRRWLVPRPIQ